MLIIAKPSQVIRLYCTLKFFEEEISKFQGSKFVCFGQMFTIFILIAEIKDVKFQESDNNEIYAITFETHKSSLFYLCFVFFYMGRKSFFWKFFFIVEICFSLWKLVFVGKGGSILVHFSITIWNINTARDIKN